MDSTDWMDGGLHNSCRSISMGFALVVCLVEYRRGKLVGPQKCIIWPGRNRESGRVNGPGKFRVPISKGVVESKIEKLGVAKEFWCGRQLGIKCRIIGSFFADGDHS